MIKKLSELQIIIMFVIFERIKGTAEIELIMSRLNKIENNQKLIIGTIRKQRGQIQQLDAALNIKQSTRQKFIYTDDSDYAGDGSGDLIVRKRKRNSKIRTRKTQRQERQACQIQCYNSSYDDIKDELMSWKILKFDLIDKVDSISRDYGSFKSNQMSEYADYFMHSKSNYDLLNSTLTTIKERDPCILI